MNTELSPAATEHLLAFADDEHMVGARHTAWIGMGPFLEEDLAFCSIAQDELGHALALYEFLVDDIPGEPNHSNDHSMAIAHTRAIDHFALLRPASDYRSCTLAELECRQWQDALVRHWLYDRAEELRWEALVGSTNQALSEIAKRSQREESFHRAHAASFMSRIARSGDQESVARITESIARLLPIAIGLWEPLALERDALAEGLISQSSDLLAAEWKSRIIEDLTDWDLPTDWPLHDPSTHSRLKRSEGFDAFLASLQEVINIDPTSTW